MIHGHRKRKHRDRSPHLYETNRPRALSPTQELHFLGHHASYQSGEVGTSTATSVESDPMRTLYIQAYEADIDHSPNAKMLAQSLEVIEYHTINSKPGVVTVVPHIGSALIQWGDSSSASYSSTKDVDVDGIPAAHQETSTSMWIDRYDVRLLLDSIESTPLARDDEGPPASPGGWSDLPSDAEDTFFFTPEEAEDYHREKRRRVLEQTREERLKARMQEDGVEEPPEDDVWGGSDEEPDESQKVLMNRTAAHLLSSPNPAQLEMRILANHGGDRRFSFLRGRWKRAWNLAKAKARITKVPVVESKQSAGGPARLGVLAGYGSSSDSETADDEREEGSFSTKPNLGETAPASTVTAIGVGEEVAKEMRRQRLKEWTEKRRSAKDLIQ